MEGPTLVSRLSGLEAFVNKFIRLWLPVILWCSLIFWLSSIATIHENAVRWGIRSNLLEHVLHKLAHLAEYGILARLWARAFTGSTFWTWKKIFFVSLLASTLYGVTDEIHQRFVIGRDGKVQDVLVDGTGAWIALGLMP
jgi:VanZ family protein